MSFANNDPYIKSTQLGVNANLGATLAVSNLASGGALITAANLDLYNIATVAQSTASQTLTLPTPTDATKTYIIFVINSGSTAFTLLSVSIGTGKLAICAWDGDSWAINV